MGYEGEGSAIIKRITSISASAASRFRSVAKPSEKFESCGNEKGKVNQRRPLPESIIDNADVGGGVIVKPTPGGLKGRGSEDV